MSVRSQIAFAIVAVATMIGIALFLRCIGVRIRNGLAMLGAALLVSLALFLCHISVPRVIGHAVAPDGTEMCLLQRCNWSGEPFTTGFYYRKPGGLWGWFYYDHQDNYWRRSLVKLDINKGVAVFYRGKSPAVTFAWTTETCTIHHLNRTMTSPQTWMSDGWNPKILAR